jgi:eukaryotic-like serine/threonine-protein kinase
MPTERENAACSPAPNDVEFTTPAHPQAPSDDKAQQIAEAAVVVNSSAETLRDSEVVGDLIAKTSAGSVITDRLVASTLQVTADEACVDPNQTFSKRAVDPNRTFSIIDSLSRSPVESEPRWRTDWPRIPRYEILGTLGRGGMAVVYKARHEGLNRLVALKMIIAGGHAGTSQMARFRIEAEAVAQLHHPNIVQIYDIGEVDGMPFVSLELLEGGDLRDRLAGTPQPGVPAAELVATLGRAVHAAHQARIVHRDLKPANVLLTADGVPKITDFGLAKRLELDDNQTQSGEIMGTPSYMAPEQALGHTKEVGPAADIYSLGAILYEMLTGRPPFKGISAMETVKQVIEEDPVLPSRVQFRVPRDLETICMKCLQKEPRKRYGTAQDLVDDLSRYLAGEPIKARRTPPIERAFKWASRHPSAATLWALGTAGFITLLSIGVWYWNYRRTLERSALRRLTEVSGQTIAELLRAQKLMSKNDLTAAEAALTARKAVLDNEKNLGLASQRQQTELMLAGLEKALAAEQARLADLLAARADVQTKYRRFLDHRKEALYRDTQFTGLLPLTNLELTRKAAEGALSVFAQRRGQGDWALGDLPDSLSIEERSEVREGCYELFMVLADVLAGQDKAQVDGALSVLESAARLRPDHPRAYHLRRASLLAAKNDRAGADRERAEAALVAPKTAFDYFLIGQDEYKRRRFADAIGHFEMALRNRPDHFWAKCLQAICFIETKSFAAAKSNLFGCLQAEPDSAWLFLLRGYASGQLGARDLALIATNPGREADLKRVAESEFDIAEADFHDALEKLKRAPDNDLQYILLVNRGSVRYQRDRLEQAAADFQRAISIKDEPDAHANLAYVYQKQGKTDEAIAQFSSAISLKPKWAALYRGRAQLMQNRPDSTPEHRAKAMADLKSAIQNEKDDKSVLAIDHTNRGKLLYLDERFTDALAETRLALDVASDYVEAQVLQIQALLKLRRYDEVIRSCDQAIATKINSAVLYELRGLAAAARADTPRAISDYGRAIGIRPDDPRLHVQRGWAYLQFDSPKLALFDFEAAIKLDAKYTDAYIGRGTAFARFGNYRAAIVDVRHALELDTSNDQRAIYHAARIYALAAPLVAAELVANGQSALSFAAKFQDTAVQLITEAVQREAPDRREAFWRDTIQADPALSAIRPRLNFEDLNGKTRKPIP